jgi:hypothetical protein
MIEQDRDFGTFDISCDECSAGEMTSTAEEWHEMLKEIKGEGWRVYKAKDGGFCHACPACVEKWKETRQ